MAKKKKRNSDRSAIGRAKDVEYSAELADVDDLEANASAAAANRRVEKKTKSE